MPFIWLFYIVNRFLFILVACVRLVFFILNKVVRKLAGKNILFTESVVKDVIRTDSIIYGKQFIYFYVFLREQMSTFKSLTYILNT